MSFLTKLWDKLMAKLGAIAGFIPGIAAALKVAIDEGDVDKVRAHAMQLDQFADALKRFAAAAIEATDDGTLDLVEGSELALLLEAIVDEGDDVIKGHDD